MFSFPDAARVLGAALELPEPSALILGASIDTRSLQPGNLFIAIRGAKQDGHDFLAAAFEKGASGAVIDEAVYHKNPGFFKSKIYRNLLPVPDPAKALVDLARAYRALFNVKTIGITGSVGKTSTKEFLAYLLAKKYKVLATAGNFNNHLGLPLTIFNLRPEHEAFVAELGANHQGEIRFLCDILKPETSILTMVAPVHVEGFGSLEGIYKAKSEILEALKPGAFAVLPDDDPTLVHNAEKLKLKPVLAGDSWRAHYRAMDVRAENGSVHFTVNKKYSFSFPGMATFLVRNAAMAIAMAEICGYKMEEMPKDWSDFKLPSGRFEQQEINGITFIFDGYNANPTAFEAALDCFVSLKTAGKKWLAFSDMGELGADEKLYHEKLGESVAGRGLSAVCYGTRSKWAAEAAAKAGGTQQIGHFGSAEEAASYLEAKLRAGDAVLLKASRSMKIEAILNHFKQKTEPVA